MGESCTEANIDTGVSAKTYILLAIILLVGLLLRLGGGTTERDLWYDELQSVIFASQSPIDLVIGVLRVDVHPPLYYMQLSAWLSVSTHDLYIIVNSLLWSLLAIAALFFSARMLFGTRCALLSAALLAVVEPAVVQGQNVRMYALMMFLAVLVFHFTERFIREGGTAVYWAFAASLFLAYSHGASFIALAAFFSYGAMRFYHRVRRGDSPSKTAKQWLIMQLVLGLCYVPWLILAAPRGGGHLSIPGAEQIVRDLSSMFIGPAGPLWLHIIVLSVVFILMIVATLYRFEYRVGGIAFLIVPAWTVYFLSVLVKPLWIDRTFFFVIPLLCLILAGGLDYLFERIRRKGPVPRVVAFAATAIVLVGATAGTIANMPTDRWRSGLRDLATYIKSNGAEGDLILGPDDRHSWGFRWYMDGRGAQWSEPPGEGGKSFAYGYFEPNIEAALRRGMQAWIVVTDNMILRQLRVPQLGMFGHYALSRLGIQEPF